MRTSPELLRSSQRKLLTVFLQHNGAKLATRRTSVRRRAEGDALVLSILQAKILANKLTVFLQYNKQNSPLGVPMYAQEWQQGSNQKAEASSFASAFYNYRKFIFHKFLLYPLQADTFPEPHNQEI